MTGLYTHDLTLVFDLARFDSFNPSHLPMVHSISIPNPATCLYLHSNSPACRSHPRQSYIHFLSINAPAICNPVIFLPIFPKVESNSSRPRLRSQTPNPKTISQPNNTVTQIHRRSTTYSQLILPFTMHSSISISFAAAGRWYAGHASPSRKKIRNTQQVIEFVQGQAKIRTE